MRELSIPEQHQKKIAIQTLQYDNPKVGCYVDESAGSADDCNRRTIRFASDYGFAAKLSGCFDGLRGLFINLTIDQSESGSHQGPCDKDIAELLKVPEISDQLDAIGPDKLRLAMREVGAWDDDELKDDDQNRARALWQACCDARENMSEQLDEMGDEAVEYLNSLETRTGMYWTFEDNSLFLLADVDSAKEQVEFVSSKDREYPPDDYQGEWLHVSDHGNATLYCRDAGKDTEIWSVV